MISIKELEAERLEEFFRYLSIHVEENGQHSTALYFPLTKEQSVLSDELKTKFSEGMNKAFGENGWRKAWVALNNEDRIVGHIDIRANNQLNAGHRVTLGMGVDINFRGSSIGQKLLESVIEYCKGHSQISWLDLDVMTHNKPAKSLYDKLGFEQLSEVKDMFRINNTSYSYTSMTLNVDG